MSSLDAAIRIDDRMALAHSLRGVAILEYGGDPGEAARSFASSTRWLPGWIPGHLGLAAVAAGEGDRAGAERYLAAAEEAVARLDEFSRRGAADVDLAPEVGPLSDEGASEESRWEHFQDMLRCSEQWTADDPPLAGPNTLARRFRARIELQRAVFCVPEFERRGAGVGEVAELFRRVGIYDPALWSARWEQARTLHAIGRQHGRPEALEAAATLLAPYAAAGGPLVKNDPRVMLELAETCVDWYIQGRDDAAAEADRLLAAITAHHYTYANAWLAYGRLRVAQALDHPRGVSGRRRRIT